MLILHIKFDKNLMYDNDGLSSIGKAHLIFAHVS